MSSYNESIKHILSEVQTFMNETLKTEKLSEKVKKHKSKILELIGKLQEEYNALKTEKVRSEEDESVFTGGSANSEEDQAYTENLRNIAAGNLNNPLKTGYLEKRRKGLMGKFTYQRRYCVIHSAVLYYFEKPTDKKQKGAFFLNGYEFREAPHLVSVSTVSKKELSFELVALGKRTYEFLAESKDEFDSWRAAVESCHNEPIDEELYEFIPEIRSPPPPTPDEGEEYEAPVIDNQEVYEELPDDVPPPVPRDRKASNLSNVSLPIAPPPPRALPPPVPTISAPDLPPALPPSLQRRDLPAVPNSPLPPIPTKHVPKLDIPDKDPSEDFENMYYGKWDCSADTNDELEFNKGDIIHVISKDFDKENWWVGEFKGSIGLVPKAYLAQAYELMP